MKVAPVSSAAAEPGDSGGSQAVKAQLRLREMILAVTCPAARALPRLPSPSSSACRARRCARR